MRKTSAADKPKQAIKRGAPRAAPAPAKTRARTVAAPAESTPEKNPRPCTPWIVGIGASAGGFEPLRELLNTMPADCGMAFVVVQHLDPRHKSLAAEILANFTGMRVLQAEEGMRVSANCVYTIPSDRFLELDGGAFHLLQQTPERGLRLPIDCFFESLGAHAQEHAVGIVLSGTGSDGAVGLRSIAEHGGIVLVQDPHTAQFDGMPLAAIATGLVSKILPVSEMPAVLAGYVRHPGAAGGDRIASVKDAPVLREVIELLLAAHGYDFGGYKQRTLLRRIKRRMGLLHVESLAIYRTLLRKDKIELKALFKDLLIGVTQFFRDRDAWKALDDEVIRALVIRKKSDEPIRVWVPGVATGEEAYSLAMLILERVRAAKKHCPVQVLATDTNEDALGIARAGGYPAGIKAHIAPALLRRYFSETGDHGYRVAQSLRDAVVFGQHNLFSDPPFSKIDLVSCRNLLIYLEAEMQKKAIQLFHFALRPSGYLFLGSAETVGQRSDLFRPVSKKWRIYQDTGAIVRQALDLRWFTREQRNAAPPYLPEPGARSGVEVANVVQQILLDRYTPAAVLVNDKCEALYYCGATERYLVQPRGAPSKDLLILLRDGLRSRVRSAIQRAQNAKASVVVNDARVMRGSAFEAVRLTVVPAGPGQDKCQWLLLVFEERPGVAPTARARRNAETPLVRQLEEELRASKEEVQSTIERLEITNEELKVANEEVISANEEMQAVNEELTSSKEELQSINEELNAVNLELQTKVAELEDANNDMVNLLASSDIATICVDHGGRIKWFSPAASRVFNVLQSDIERPVADLAALQSNVDLIADVRKVLKTLAPVQSEVRFDNGRIYARRTLPFRMRDGRIDGAMITYSDITESQLKAQQELEAKSRAMAVLEEAVAQRTGQLRELIFELTMAEERERRAIAVDLHDDLGQVLALINIRLQTITQNGPEQNTAVVEEIGKLIRRAEDSVRSLAFQISPPVLFELGLGPALEWLAEEMQRDYHLRVTVRDTSRPKSLDGAARSVLFRCVRELLINVAKHAKVDSACVDLSCDHDHLVVSIADGGVGFDVGKLKEHIGSRRLGLISLRERVSFVGGRVVIQSVDKGGTLVTISVPLSGVKPAATGELGRAP